MLICKASNLHKEWNGVTLFEKVSFEVKNGERLALFGSNGTGKTTLLQALLGRIPLSDGNIERMLPLQEWGWMDQQADPGGRLTVLEFVQSGSEQLYRLKRRYTVLSESS